MKAIKGNNLYRLFLLLSKNRKKQIYFLFVLLIFNGISESIALISIIPYLSLIISDKNNLNSEFINKYLFINLNNDQNILLYLTILFCLFIFISTVLRIFNNWYILKLTAKINVDLSTVINTQPIRFFKNPTTEFQEIVQPKTALIPISQSIVRNTASGIPRSDLKDKIIQIESGSLEKESLPKEVSDTFKYLRRFKD